MNYRRDSSLIDGMVKAFLLFLLSIITLMELVYQDSDGIRWFWYWSILFILVVLHPIMSYIRRKFDFFEIINIFLLGYFLNFFLTSILMYLNDEWAVFKPYWTWSVFGKGLFYVDVALIMFYFGYYSSVTKMLSMILRRMPFLHFAPNFSIARATVIYLLFFSFYLMSTIFLIMKLGGIISFFAYGRGRVAQYGYGFLQPFTTLGPILIPFGYLYLYKNNYHNTSLCFRKIIFFVISIITFISSLTQPSRGSVFSWLVMLIVCKHYLEKTVTFKKIFLFAVVFLITSNFILLVRGGSVLSWNSYKENFAHSITDTFASFGALLAILTHFPQKLPYYGLSPILEELILPIIPRVIWPSKEAVYGADRIWEDIAGLISGGNSQFFVSMPGELYAYFGFFGIVIGMFLIGVAFKSIYLIVQKKNLACILLYSYLMILVFSFPGGIPLTYVFLQYFALPLLALKYIHKTHKMGFRV